MFRKLFAKKQKFPNNDIDINKIDLEKLPKHIGIIMDGNGRWATQKGLIRTSGHSAGVNTLKEIIEIANNINLEILTVYAFSTENWKRPKLEIDFLMNLFSTFLAKELPNLMKENIRLKFIGKIENLPNDLPKELVEAEALTKNNTGLLLVVAVNYGGKDEILSAIKNIAKLYKESKINIEDINEDLLEKNLYTEKIPPVDLMIRTSGDMRLSNFLLWQSAYAELWFTDVNWPDFTKEDFLKAIIDYQRRDRRFGGVK